MSGHSWLTPAVKAGLKALWRDKLDVIFPPCCVHCGGLTGEGRLRFLCPACEQQLFIVSSALELLRSVQGKLYGAGLQVCLFLCQIRAEFF